MSEPVFPHGLTPEEMGAMLDEFASDGETEASIAESMRRLGKFVGLEFPSPTTSWERDGLVDRARQKIEESES